MIPEELDDGFTQEPASGTYCRPMLWETRQRWTRVVNDCFPEGRRMLLSSPFLYGESTEEHQIVAIQTILAYTSAQESKDFQDLSDSVHLHVNLNPGLSLLSCDDCRRYAVDHETGVIQLGYGDKPKPVPPGIEVPCETVKGCPKQHWSIQTGLSNPRWSKTWRHFWRYRDDRTFALASCPLFGRNRILMNWIVDYGRNRRFDPFVGIVSSGGGPADTTEGDAGPDSDRASSQ
jgi:hypothetical protein